ncbi:MAG: tRNA epoxyqueuosine(34) reductase QueG [Pedosphaera sp. Tous-C6FEB]|nr:MAG: tRNA epoxyqueuosine(34) reductase QueG [Pedosphaera sp. Tous-C6FEB]
MKEVIRQRARELGFDDCRFTRATPPDHTAEFLNWIATGQHGEMGYLARNAHKRVEPEQVLAEARSVISLAVSYAGPGAAVGEGTPHSERGPLKTGTVARYARFADYHDVLAAPLKQLTEAVNQLGGTATRSLWYVDTGPLLERDLAQRAGLGFAGKHTNLISRRLGNWFFLAEIITTLELAPDEAEKNRCGSCTRCLTACPTQAITAPFQLDARRCISYLTIELKGAIPVEFRPAIGNRIYGCDDCLAACPWNKFAQTGSLLREHARGELAQPDLIELLALDDAGFKQRFAGTPMLRTKRRGLLRNVCVALGNVGDATALPHLERAASDPEPLIAEHARWAIERITATVPPRATR